MPGRSARIDVERLDERTAAVSLADDPLGEAASALFACVCELLTGGTAHVIVQVDGSLLNSKLVDALERASGSAPDGGGIAIDAPPGYQHQVLEIRENGGPVMLAEPLEDALEALGA